MWHMISYRDIRDAVKTIRSNESAPSPDKMRTDQIYEWMGDRQKERVLTICEFHPVYSGTVYPD